MPTLENAGMCRDKKTFKNLVYMFINYIHISDIQYYMLFHSSDVCYK